MKTKERKQTTFHLSTDLIAKLKSNAKIENKSFNNYVETLLLDALYKELNEETIEAIKEAIDGKSSGRLDVSNFDSFMKSINDIR